MGICGGGGYPEEFDGLIALLGVGNIMRYGLCSISDSICIGL